MVNHRLKLITSVKLTNLFELNNVILSEGLFFRIHILDYLKMFHLGVNLSGWSTSLVCSDRGSSWERRRELIIGVHIGDNIEDGEV